jgi:hypothetical protein
MIGHNQILMRSLVQYFYSGGDCEDEEPLFQPPTGGCYLRLDAGSGGSGTIVITGTYAGEDIEETITSFNSEGIAISDNRFSTISAIDVTLEDSSSITIYPASEIGDIINYSTYTSSYIRCNWNYTSSTANNKVEIDVGGAMVKAEIKIEYNKNYDIKRDDLLYIDGSWRKVGVIQTASRSQNIAYLTNTGEVTA